MQLVQRYCRPALDRAYQLASNFSPTRRLANWAVRNSDYFADRAYLISFPKCGRTWLRLMMGRALALHAGIDVELNDMLALRPLAERIPGVVDIRVTHEGHPHQRHVEELKKEADKRNFRHKRVILLIRDVRDVMVSMYFQNTRRTSDQRLSPELLEDLETFVRSGVGSLDSFLTFYRIWYEAREIPRRFLVVRYEDLHADSNTQLRRVLDCVGLTSVSDEVIDNAVEFARFENMRAMELAGASSRKMLVPGDANDPESYKTRKGVVGGFQEYLSPSLADYITERARKELPDFYGYSY